jgi:hypothetical protein
MNHLNYVRSTNATHIARIRQLAELQMSNSDRCLHVARKKDKKKQNF